MFPTASFIGQRIYLRGLGKADATDAYASWLNDPEVNRFLATKGATIPELQAYIAAKNQQPDALFFGIFLCKNDECIGTIKLEPIDIAGKRATIAIMIGNTAYWGKGFGCEAMQLLIDYCFRELGFDEINLGVIGENINAIRAYEKLGFREVKRDVKAVQYGDTRYDQVWMTLPRP